MNSETFSQVMSRDARLKDGFLHQIRGRITSLDVKLTMTEQQDGLSKAKLSQNGNHHLVLFCGFTENVRDSCS